MESQMANPNLMSSHYLCATHGPHNGISCPQCWHASSEKYKDNQRKLTKIAQAFCEYFNLPNTGSLPLDTIVSECLSHPLVREYLSQSPAESLEYYLLQTHITDLIKTQIKMYIDCSLIPE